MKQRKAIRAIMVAQAFLGGNDKILINCFVAPYRYEVTIQSQSSPKRFFFASFFFSKKKEGFLVPSRFLVKLTLYYEKSCASIGCSDSDMTGVNGIYRRISFSRETPGAISMSRSPCWVRSNTHRSVMYFTVCPKRRAYFAFMLICSTLQQNFRNLPSPRIRMPP